MVHPAHTHPDAATLSSFSVGQTNQIPPPTKQPCSVVSSVRPWSVQLDTPSHTPTHTFPHTDPSILEPLDGWMPGCCALCTHTWSHHPPHRQTGYRDSVAVAVAEQSAAGSPLHRMVTRVPLASVPSPPRSSRTTPPALCPCAGRAGRVAAVATTVWCACVHRTGSGWPPRPRRAARSLDMS